MGNMIPKKPNTSSKKLKHMGIRHLIDPVTGEDLSFYYSDYQERDVNFTKVWMKNFLSQIDELANQKFKVAMYIMENTRDDNIFIGTIRNINKKTKISIPTIHETMTILISNNFMKRVSNGVYMINADIMFKGNHGNRIRILNEYSQLDAPEIELSKEEKVKNLKNSIKQLRLQIKKLEEE